MKNAEMLETLLQNFLGISVLGVIWNVHGNQTKAITLQFEPWNRTNGLVKQFCGSNHFRGNSLKFSVRKAAS